MVHQCVAEPVWNRKNVAFLPTQSGTTGCHLPSSLQIDTRGIVTSWSNEMYIDGQLTLTNVPTWVSDVLITWVSRGGQRISSTASQAVIYWFCKWFIFSCRLFVLLHLTFVRSSVELASFVELVRFCRSHSITLFIAVQLFILRKHSSQESYEGIFTSSWFYYVLVM